MIEHNNNLPGQDSSIPKKRPAHFKDPNFVSPDIKVMPIGSQKNYEDNFMQNDSNSPSYFDNPDLLERKYYEDNYIDEINVETNQEVNEPNYEFVEPQDDAFEQKQTRGLKKIIAPLSNRKSKVSEAGPETEYSISNKDVQHNNPYAEDSQDKDTSVTRRAFLSIAAIGAVGALGYVGAKAFWDTRPITATVSGQPTQLNPGTTLSQVAESLTGKTKAGNLISISGNVLKEGAGQPWQAQINGHTYTPEDTYVIQDADEVVFLPGLDIEEKTSTKTKTINPNMEFAGEKSGVIQYVSSWPVPKEIEILVGDVSGEEIEGKTLHDGQNMVITTGYIRPDNGEKLIGLTFDDGPSVYTKRYLDILKAYGAHATFFNIGSSVAENPSLTAAIVEAGHQIANHSYTHPALTTLDPKDVRSELENTTSAIKEASGVYTTMVRPPYGDFKNNTWYNTHQTMSSKIIWTHDSQDWRRPGVQAIVQNSTANLFPGAVILMHDGGGPREQDIEALPQILDILAAQGYKAVSMKELMESDSSIPKDIADGSAKAPEDAVWPEIEEAQTR